MVNCKENSHHLIPQCYKCYKKAAPQFTFKAKKGRQVVVSFCMASVLVCRGGSGNSTLCWWEG